MKFTINGFNLLNKFILIDYIYTLVYSFNKVIPKNKTIHMKPS